LKRGLRSCFHHILQKVVPFLHFRFREVTTSSEQKMVTTFIGTKNPASGVYFIYAYKGLGLHQACGKVASSIMRWVSVHWVRVYYISH
jgi:hypothetical protein